jgi:hypothetical protein
MTTNIIDPRIIEANDVAAKADPNAFKHSEVRKIKRGFKAAIDMVAEQQHNLISLREDLTYAQDDIDRKRVIIEGLDAVTDTFQREIAELKAKNDQADADLCAHQTIIQEQGNQIAELTATNDALRDDVTALILERNHLATMLEEISCNRKQ